MSGVPSLIMPALTVPLRELLLLPCLHIAIAHDNIPYPPPFHQTFDATSDSGIAES
jgi:hypothetical protein